jgi:hypothetical protein
MDESAIFCVKMAELFPVNERGLCRGWGRSFVALCLCVCVCVSPAVAAGRHDIRAEVLFLKLLLHTTSLSLTNISSPCFELHTYVT